ncbi:hypothetical protein AMAG_00148 [Allomyces macrogynus ATCC 38327]|uniref:BZIP domain-containing protein n=1 Tax=Allomyces macrogynus (strain ATCC 38327) TaxID=578462 RepID=A0A0L0RVN3_ALLM3|nr:hypothetical protein AMAG_00148 [Allomyces macrogynus ATCC 38327]|eukprot:KNE54150.1 hypothetical protein AMAG_00148 [Allomyces macrogynus ATCC 38327]
MDSAFHQFFDLDGLCASSVPASAWVSRAPSPAPMSMAPFFTVPSHDTDLPPFPCAPAAEDPAPLSATLLADPSAPWWLQATTSSLLAAMTPPTTAADTAALTRTVPDDLPALVSAADWLPPSPHADTARFAVPELPPQQSLVMPANMGSSSSLSTLTSPATASSATLALDPHALDMHHVAAFASPPSTPITAQAPHHQQQHAAAASHKRKRAVTDDATTAVALPAAGSFTLAPAPPARKRKATGSPAASTPTPKPAIPVSAKTASPATAAKPASAPASSFPSAPTPVPATLSAKERRQLRNKISARNFRQRRKEYLSHLEDQVAALQAEALAERHARWPRSSKTRSCVSRFEDLMRALAATNAPTTAPVMPPMLPAVTEFAWPAPMHRGGDDEEDDEDDDEDEYDDSNEYGDAGVQFRLPQ